MNVDKREASDRLIQVDIVGLIVDGVLDGEIGVVFEDKRWRAGRGCGRGSNVGTGGVLPTTLGYSVHGRLCNFHNEAEEVGCGRVEGKYVVTWFTVGEARN